MTFQTQCPHCGKVLKLKSEAAVGRKAPCPKCKTPFVVEPYEEPAADEWDEAGDEYNDSDDDYGDYGEDYEEAVEHEKDVEPAPARSSRKSGSKGAKKKKQAAGRPAWLAPVGIGLAVLLGLGLLGGGVAFLVTGSNEPASAGGPSSESQQPPAEPDAAATVQVDSDSNAAENAQPAPQQPIADLADPAPGNTPNSADAATQADIDALQQERQRVLDQTDEIKSRIKSGTGSILDSVPGSRGR